MKKISILTIMLTIAILSKAQINFIAEVKNASTYASVEGAFVRLVNKSNVYTTYSTPNGTVQVSALPIGTYSVSIHHQSYETLLDTLIVSNDRQANYPIFFLNPQTTYLDAAVISAIRAKNQTPITFSTITQKDIQSQDQSKDFPFLLNLTPSTVISSDAGNGVGYTGVRIRGIDPTRVNVSVNGIPINDAESQGMYWVNMPDIASSTESVQIQRGIGTSTNGAASFGASINIINNDLSNEPQTKAVVGMGSFNTQRISLMHQTGRTKNNWAFMARGSMLKSDGYIDLASSNLYSANIVAAKYLKKHTFKTNIMLGQERTYQAWEGIPQPKYQGDAQDMARYISQLGMSENDIAHLNQSNAKTYNLYTYQNQVDFYKQNHYQFFYDYTIAPFLEFHSAAYVTTGKGYFEQFKAKEKFSNYGLANTIIGSDTFSRADLIRRRWLDNTLVGSLADIHYYKNKIDLVLGGGISTYANRHFGEAIATEFTNYEEINQLYYDNDASKSDANVYIKSSYNFKNLIPYLDIQYRTVAYQFQGLDNILEFGNQSVNFSFFNPKAGLTYLYNAHTFYGMYGIGNREPVRDDFRNNKPTDWPKHEKLNNTEIGYRYARKSREFSLNYFDMRYTDQLVLTGAVNDVGEYIRTNVPNSFRRGIELAGQMPLNSILTLGGNITLSENKIEKFTEELSNWEDGSVAVINYKNTDIAFSPAIIGAAILGVKMNENLSLQGSAKYVGHQYLDNTQSEQRALKPFTNLDFSMMYETKKVQGARKLNVGFYVNNVLDKHYAPNGYTFSGVLSGSRQDFNYLYPMAGINWMIKVIVEL